MSLLFQRQDDPVEVVWAGRAGDYLEAELRQLAARFPTRPPTESDRVGPNAPRDSRPGTSKQIAREQRVARGLCSECPNRLDFDNEFIRCRSCRIKVADREYQRQQRRRDRTHAQRRYFQAGA